MHLSKEKVKREYVLLLDGKPLRDSEFTYSKRGGFSIWLGNKDAKSFLSCTMAEIKEFIVHLVLPIRLDFWPHPSYLFWEISTYRILSFSLKIVPTEWANPYSISECYRTISSMVKRSGARDIKIDLEVEDESENFLRFDCRTSPANATLGDEIEYWGNRIKEIHGQAVTSLITNLKRDSVVTLFCFPQSIKTTCQQYLLYFVQFLEDLGIKAESEIKEDAGEVLFSVKPVDGRTALHTIKMALDVYLKLPGSPELNIADDQFTDIAVTQLKSNVLFLQAQLELAKATIQAKDATIRALDMAIFQRQLLVTRPTIQKDEPTPPKKDEEPLLGDTVHVTSLEGKGFRVDLPRILRRLKRAFAPKKADSILKAQGSTTHDQKAETKSLLSQPKQLP